MLKTVWAGAMLALMGGTACAAEPGKITGFAGLDLGAGGDVLVPVQYTDGTSDNLRAGRGTQFKLGLDYRLEPEWSVVGSLGYHLSSVRARNGSVKFERFPLELMAKYHYNDRLRIGFGVRMPFEARVSSSGAAVPTVGDYRLSSRKGLIVDAEYLFGQFGLSLRWTNESYRQGTKEIDAAHYSLGLNYYF
ncbi:hypothetical protein [Ideonella sp.]|uniref:hypothetical protein n=1 Tax=Ideonella sp. TaxID=1929293 RepID=UPI0037BFD57B